MNVPASPTTWAAAESRSRGDRASTDNRLRLALRAQRDLACCTPDAGRLFAELAERAATVVRR